MKEIYGNLWDQLGIKVVTTNGYVRNDGRAVMGRGCALEAAQKYTWLPKKLGQHITTFGNHVFMFDLDSIYPLHVHNVIFTFPVKHNWQWPADPLLIERSAKELAKIVRLQKIEQPIILPRPGCGNGGLRWENVKPFIADILDDQYYVVTFSANNV